MKVSENGVPIQTGRGVEEAKRRIMEAFERVRQPEAPRQALQPALLPESHYTETQRERFHQLILRALNSPSVHISKPSPNGVFEIVPPTESEEKLIREALSK